MAAIEKLLMQAFFVILLLVLLPKHSEAFLAVERWPQAVIPYTFNHELSPTKRRWIKKAMYEIHLETCVTYVPWRIESAYVEFAAGRVCDNPYGKRFNGMHTRYIFSFDPDEKEGCKRMSSIRQQLIKIAGGDSIEDLNRLYECSW